MVPDKFNMVDMDGIDLIMMQGEEVPGLYMRLVESIAQCRYQCLYNWFFDGVVIPPTYVKMEVNEDDEIEINEGVTVSPDDTVHIYSIEPPPPEPIINPISITENGEYTAPSGVDGYSPIVVNVPSAPVDPSLPSDYQEVEYLTLDGKAWVTVSDLLFTDFEFDITAKQIGSSGLSRLAGYRLTSGTNAADFDLRLSETAVTGFVRSGHTNQFSFYGVTQSDNIVRVQGTFYNLRNGFFLGKYYNETDAGAGLPFAGNIYRYEVYDPLSYEKKLKFIPCYRKSDDVIGFYEVFRGIFYPNEGTGAFGKGPDVN